MNKPKHLKLILTEMENSWRALRADCAERRRQNCRANDIREIAGAIVRERRICRLRLHRRQIELNKNY